MVKYSEFWTLYVQKLDTICSKITHITETRSAFRKDFYKDNKLSWQKPDRVGLVFMFFIVL